MRSSILIACLIALLAPRALADPIPVSNQKQLFFDDRFIASSENTHRRLNQGQKIGPLLDQNGNKIEGHVNQVIEDGGKIRLYIGADHLSIYESDDGLHFTNTGKSIGRGIFPTLLLDSHEPDPARRYKMFYITTDTPFNTAVHGVQAAWSADGVNFSEGVQVLPFYCDNPPIVLWDGRINSYVIYTRVLERDAENERRITRMVTDDPLKPWPWTKTDKDDWLLTPANSATILETDSEDDPYSDFYYNAATIYPWAQDVYLMSLAPFRHFMPNRQPFLRPKAPGQWEDFGMLEIQLAVSRDGIKWDRPSREPYFPMGLGDEWDRWYATMAQGIARHGNYLYQYYTSSGRTHDGLIIRAEYDDVKDLGGIGAIKQRLDGYYSIDADHKGGWLETPAITFSGKKLRLNIDTGAMGTAFVELRDDKNQPIPGFTLADCEEIGGNFIDQAVNWKGGPDVSSLAGKPVKMHIKLTRGKLYAFQFTDK